MRGRGARRRFLTVLLITGLLGSVVFVGVSGAHTFTASTTVTIHKIPTGTTKPGARVVLFGKLKSARPACRRDKVIQLWRTRPGRDLLVARTRTSFLGNYHFTRHPKHSHTFYSRFPGTVFKSYGHFHRCLPDRSPNILVRVR
jgi:hypothetical protein